MRHIANRRVIVALLAGLLLIIFAAATAFAQSPPHNACTKIGEVAPIVFEVVPKDVGVCGPQT